MTVVHFIGFGDFDPETPVDLPLGRSGAHVRTKKPLVRRIGTDAWGAVYQATEDDDNSIIKWHDDDRITSIEHALYQRLTARGLPLAKVLGFDGHLLEIEKVWGPSLRAQYSHLWFPCYASMEPLETTKANFVALMNDAVDLSARIDQAVDEELTDDEKSYLRSAQHARLAERMGVPVAEVAQRPHTYRIMDALHIGDARFPDACAPLESLLQRADARYGQWTWGCHVDNFKVRPDGSLCAIDFNNAQYSAVQDSDAYLMDAYLPCKDLKHFDFEPNPFDPEEITKFIDRRISLLETLRNTSIDRADYHSSYYPVRVVRGLRQFGHATDEVREIAHRGGYLPGDIYDRVQEARTSYLGAMRTLHHLSQKDAALKPLIERINERGMAQLTGAYSEEQWSQLIDVMKSL